MQMQGQSYNHEQWEQHFFPTSEFSVKNSLFGKASRVNFPPYLYMSNKLSSLLIVTHFASCSHFVFTDICAFFFTDSLCQLLRARMGVEEPPSVEECYRNHGILSLKVNADRCGSIRKVFFDNPRENSQTCFHRLRRQDDGAHQSV